MSKIKQTATSIDEFLIILQNYERITISKFVCIRSDRAFSEAKFTPLEKNKIFWNGDIPQYHIGNRVYACHQGKDSGLYNKKKYAEKRNSKACDDHNFTKRRNSMQPTKKLNCPVIIYVTRVLALPRFKVSKLTNYEKKKMAEAIRSKIRIGEEIAGENVYSFNLPDEASHQNHVTGLTAAVVETIDPNVRSKIKELVSQGQFNICIITVLLEHYVVNELGETDKFRGRFYPQRHCIRSIVNRFKREMRYSKLDVENTEHLVKKWKEESGESSGSNIYFRPCTLEQNHSELCTQQEEIDDECEEENEALRWKQTPSNHLLFIYQSKQMKYLYHRYGKDGVLLDATYKTCKWALPLYFLAVKANVGYQPVAVFITQYETTRAISEALNFIKQWNPEVILKFAMVDFAMEEILALESVFPGVEVFICSFHREQAWKRWSSKAYISSSVPPKETLKKLREIANAPTEKKLQEAIEKLKKWNYYNDSPLKNYFERTWLPEIKRWTLVYKPLGFHFHTNNGVERINKELKYNYLKENKNCSLSEMLNIVVTRFLPGRYKSYVHKNISLMSTYKNYSDDIPKFLHNRPQGIVSFVMEKMDFLNEENKNQPIVNKLTETSYKVSSLTYKNVSYKVNCNDTTNCTCEDFLRNRILCKHMILISKEFPEFNIGTLVLKNEVYRIDKTVVHLETKSSSNTPQKTMDEIEPNDLLFCPEQQEYAKLATRKSKKKKKIAICNSTIRSLQSVMWNLEEKYLDKLSNGLQQLYKDATLHVTADKDTALPIATIDLTNTKRKTMYAKLPKPARKKVRRFGHAADTKKNEMQLLNTLINEDDDKNTSFDNTPPSNITDYHETSTIFTELIRNFPHTVDVNTSKSTIPPKKKLKGR